MTDLPRVRIVWMSVVIACVAATCSAYQSGVGSIAPDKSPGPSPDGTLGEEACYTVSVQGEVAPETMANLASLSSDIMVGTFEGFGKPFWNTPDGLRPSHDALIHSSATIVRPLLVTVDSALRGNPSDFVQFSLVGGQIGCDSITYQPQDVVTPGTRYAFFARPVTDSLGQSSRGFGVTSAWAVNGTTIQTPVDGVQTLDSLKQVIASKPFSGAPDLGSGTGAAGTTDPSGALESGAP